MGGALYLAWLGLRSIRDAGRNFDTGTEAGTPPPHGALREGVLVALSNPKSLVYIVALLPPFVDADLPVGPQLVVLALVAMAIDVAVGAAYIGAGKRLANAMTRPRTRRRFDLAVGVLFLVIAAGILADLASA